ncbi:MAG TPA: signal peptidase II [Paracoccaceae bacterium]|jgi:signal peptidase II|nr:signal peptidase II [Paracoccaceae bacterium]
MRVVLSAAVIFVLDQITKVWIVFGLNLIERGVIEVAPPYLRLTMAWNRGVNFGLLAHDSDVVRWGLVAVALAISAWVWVWIRKPGHGLLAQVSGGVLIGGALGNVVDRVLYGAVADFLNMSCCGFVNPYAFNVADIAIFAGAIGLVLFAADGKAPADKGPKTP